MRVPLFIFATAFIVSGCGGSGSSSSSNNNPSGPQARPGGAVSGESNFAKLITSYPQGRAGMAPWIGYWWPYSAGGIVDATPLYEKASGKTGATDWEKFHHGSSTPGIQQWWGHCNGWAAAATLFHEPTATKTVNGVDFTIADQKALLSEASMEVDADFFGQRDDSDDPNSATFQDVFPDQFYLVLSNYIGTGMTLIMDRYTGSQVWNQPIAGYQHSPVTPEDVLPPDPSAPGVTRVNMTTQVWWANDEVDPSALTGPFEFQDNNSFESRTYKYELWLDAPVQFDSQGKITGSGNVILTRSGPTVQGGIWKNGDVDLMNSHPDYLWVAHKPAQSTGFSNPQVDPVWVSSHLGS